MTDLDAAVEAAARAWWERVHKDDLHQVAGEQLTDDRDIRRAYLAMARIHVEAAAPHLRAQAEADLRRQLDQQSDVIDEMSEDRADAERERDAALAELGVRQRSLDSMLVQFTELDAELAEVRAAYRDAVQWRDDGGLRLRRGPDGWGILDEGQLITSVEIMPELATLVEAAIHNSGQYKRMWAMLAAEQAERGEPDDLAKLRARWEADVRASERAEVRAELEAIADEYMAAEFDVTALLNATERIANTTPTEESRD